MLKKALKYAPLKSDFVRGVTADETIKTELNEDMYTVADTTEYAPDNSVIDAQDVDYQDIKADPDTGEVIENA